MALNQVIYNDLQNILQTVPDGKLGDVLKLVQIAPGVIAPRWAPGWRKWCPGTATASSPQTINSTTFTSASGFPKSIPNSDARTVVFSLGACWNRSTIANNFEIKLFVNGVEVIFREIEAADQNGSFGSTGSDQKLVLAARTFPIAVAASNVNVDVQFRGENVANTSLWDVMLEAEEIDSADIV